MPLEKLEDLVMKLRTDESLRVKDQQYVQENAVEFTEHTGDTMVMNNTVLFVMYVMIPYMIAAYNKLTAESDVL